MEEVVYDADAPEYIEITEEMQDKIEEALVSLESVETLTSKVLVSLSTIEKELVEVFFLHEKESTDVILKELTNSFVLLKAILASIGTNGQMIDESIGSTYLSLKMRLDAISDKIENMSKSKEATDALKDLGVEVVPVEKLDEE